MASIVFNSLGKNGTSKTPEKKSKITFSSLSGDPTINKVYPKPEAPKSTLSKIGGAVKDVAKEVASSAVTIPARIPQAVASIAGASNEDINRVSSKLSGGLIAPVPESGADVMKDVGRLVETASFGIPGSTAVKIAAGGAVSGLGTSMRQGNDILSKETALNVGAGAAFGYGLGKVLPKVMPKFSNKVAQTEAQVAEDVVSSADNGPVQYPKTEPVYPMGEASIPQKAKTMAVNDPLSYQTPEEFVKAQESKILQHVSDNPNLTKFEKMSEVNKVYNDKLKEFEALDKQRKSLKTFDDIEKFDDKKWLELKNWLSTNDKIKLGERGANAGEGIYLSSKPDFWRAALESEGKPMGDYTYDVLVTNPTKAKEYMQTAGGGQMLPETLIQPNEGIILGKSGEVDVTKKLTDIWKKAQSGNEKEAVFQRIVKSEENVPLRERQTNPEQVRIALTERIEDIEDVVLRGREPLPGSNKGAYWAVLADEAEKRAKLGDVSLLMRVSGSNAPLNLARETGQTLQSLSLVAKTNISKVINDLKMKMLENKVPSSMKKDIPAFQEAEVAKFKKEYQKIMEEVSSTKLTKEELTNVFNSMLC